MSLYGQIDTTLPDERTLAQQVGRWWAAFGRGPSGSELVFVEDADTGKGHLYARALPELKHRQSTACSITLETSGFEDGPTRKILMTFEAHAPLRRQAESLLHDLLRVFRPGGREFHRPPTDHVGAIDLSGMIGTPPSALLTDGLSTDLWRVLEVEVTAPIQTLNIEASERATADQQAAAFCTLAFTVVPGVLAAPLNAMRIWHSGAGGVDAAEARIRPAVVTTGSDVRTQAATLELRRSTDGGATWTSNSIDLAGNTFDEVVSLIDLIAATGWHAEAPIEWDPVSERDADEAEYFAWSDAHGEPNKHVIRAWA